MPDAIEHALLQGFTHVQTVAGWVPLEFWEPPNRSDLEFDGRQLVGPPVPHLQPGDSEANAQAPVSSFWTLSRMQRPGSVTVQFKNYAGGGEARHLLHTWPRLSQELLKAGLSKDQVLRIEAAITGGNEYTEEKLGITIKARKPRAED